MPRVYRDKDGLLRGTLDYDGGGRITIVDHIVPVLLPCVKCNAFLFHVLGSEHAGLGFQIPFVGTVASTHKRYGLLCNDCTTMSGVYGYDLLRVLESRILPASVCDPLDRILAIRPDAPPAYSRGFTAFMCSLNPEWGNDATWLAAYRRFDGR
jgi:hypothetical protein